MGIIYMRFLIAILQKNKNVFSYRTVDMIIKFSSTIV